MKNNEFSKILDEIALKNLFGINIDIPKEGYYVGTQSTDIPVRLITYEKNSQNPNSFSIGSLGEGRGFKHSRLTLEELKLTGKNIED